MFYNPASIRVDAKKDNMGLTTWENSSDGKILKSDVVIAKNYLDEKEVKNLRFVLFHLTIYQNQIHNYYLE